MKLCPAAFKSNFYEAKTQSFSPFVQDVNYLSDQTFLNGISYKGMRSIIYIYFKFVYKKKTFVAGVLMKSGLYIKELLTTIGLRSY